MVTRQRTWIALSFTYRVTQTQPIRSAGLKTSCLNLRKLLSAGLFFLLLSIIDRSSHNAQRTQTNFLYARHLTDVLWYGSVRLYDRPYVRSVVHNTCGQDIARTIWPRMLKLSVYILYGQRKKPIHFQGQRSHFKVTGPLQRILALGSLWAGYSKNYLA